MTDKEKEVSETVLEAINESEKEDGSTVNKVNESIRKKSIAEKAILKLEENFSDYKRSLDVARMTFIGLLGTLITLFRSSELIDEIKTGSINPLTLLPILLLVCTLILGILWIIASEYELSKLKIHIGMYFSKKKMTTVVLSISIPMLIFLLAAFSNNILYYSAIYFVYTSVDIFTRKYVSLNVFEALYRSGYKFNGLDGIRGCIYKFYITRNVEFRGYIVGSLSLISFFLAFCGEFFTIEEISKESLIVLSYLILISTMILSEVVLWHWRRPLYKCISEKEDD